MWKHFWKVRELKNEILGNEWGSANMNCPLKELFAHMWVGTQSAQATRLFQTCSAQRWPTETKQP
jgi:hypothetical protein